MILFVLFAVCVVLVGFIRLAPSDPSVWHQDLSFNEDADLTGGVRRVRNGDMASEAGLERLNAIILATPRTEVLAGSVDAGRITYVTRSAVIGFPDYTTCELDGDKLMVFGRLRFGRSDLGVNKRRVDGWLDGLGGSGGISG